MDMAVTILMGSTIYPTEVEGTTHQAVVMRFQMVVAGFTLQGVGVTYKARQITDAISNGL